jgi:hypothetical protein
LRRGYAAWFINAANSSSPFGFPQDPRSLELLMIGTVFVICATAAAQIGLNPTPQLQPFGCFPILDHMTLG